MPKVSSRKRLYNARYYQEHKLAIKQQVAKWRKENSLHFAVKNAEYRRKHKLRYNEYHAAYYAENADRLRAKANEYRKRNLVRLRAGRAAAEAKRRAAMLQATPPWLTAEQFKQIAQIYCEAKRLEQTDGVKRHVDHIYPLRGKTVSGLHVPWNLQVMVAEENLRKSNKTHGARI